MSEDSGATADEVARLLRQRMEMGGAVTRKNGQVAFSVSTS